MAKLEDDLKIKAKVASPEIRAVATVMNSMVFKKIIHDDTLIGDGENEPLGVNREQFLPQNDLLNFRDVGWGLSTLNIVAQPWGSAGMAGMTMLTMSGNFAGQFLSTSDNIDPDTGARYNTFDVCAMNSAGQASGFVCRLDEGETQGTVELFSPKEMPVDDDSNFVASTHWVQKALQNLGGDGVWGSLLVKTSTGYKWADVLERGVEILTQNTFGTPMLRMSAGGENVYTFFIQETGLELSMIGGRYSINFPTEGGTLARLEDVENKQDKLTAGENITIVDGVISATSGGDYLPLSGGTLTGLLTLTAEKTEYSFQSGRVLKIITESEEGGKKEFNITANGLSIGFNSLKLVGVSGLNPSVNDSYDIGASFVKWRTVYTTKLNNGEDIAIPTTGGTMALKEDIDAAVGDISTALTAILGE